MLYADWLGAPRLHMSRIIGARGIKTWSAFGAPSHFLYLNHMYIFPNIPVVVFDVFLFKY